MAIEWLEHIKKIVIRGAAVPRVRPRLIIIGLGGVALICAVVLAAEVLSQNRGKAKPSAGEEITGALAPRAIPADELFLPSEPDFLPGIILGRERRELWTAEDALPYWTDPLEGGSAPYIDRTRGIIDGIMERIP